MCFPLSLSHLQVVVAHWVARRRHMVVDTLAEAAQAGGVGLVAGLGAGRRPDQEAAGAGGVLAHTPAGALLQRR